MVLSFSVLLSPWIGSFADCHGPRLLSIIGLVLSALNFALLGTIITSDSNPRKVLLYGLLILLGVGVCCVQIPNIAEISVMVKREEELRPGRLGKGGGMAQGYALLNMAYGIGTLIGPVSAGLFVDHLGWPWMCLCFAGLNGLSVVLMAFFSGEGLRKKITP